MKKGLIYLLLLFSAFQIQAQYLSVYGGDTTIETAHAAVSDNNQNIYICGSIKGVGNRDAYLLALDSVGNMLWEKRYDFGLEEELTGIVVHSQTGEIWAVGSSGTALSNHPLVLRINAGNGLINDYDYWVKPSTTTRHQIDDIKEASNGDLVLTGKGTTSTGPWGGMFLRLDAISGAVLQQVLYEDESRYIGLLESSSRWFMFGACCVNNFEPSIQSFSKSDLSNTPASTRYSYFGDFEGEYRDAQPTNNGFVVVGADSRNVVGYNNNYFLKMTPSGNVYQVKYYWPYYAAYNFVDLKQHIQGSDTTYISGMANPGYFGGTDLMLMKLDADGDLLWIKGYGDNSKEDNTVNTLIVGNKYVVVGNQITRSGPAILTSDIIVANVNQSDGSIYASCNSRPANLYTTNNTNLIFRFSPSTNFVTGLGLSAGATSSTAVVTSQTKMEICISLPVSFGDFYAIPSGDNKSVFLHWQTESESQNDFFTLERSEDGHNFEEIARLKSKGDSQTQQDYRYEDREVLNTKYHYRVKQTDYDGEFSYSSVVEVSLHPAFEIKVLENPAKDQLSIRKNHLVPCQIYLKDLKGETLLHALWGQTPDFQLPLEQVAEGLYLLEIRAEGIQCQQKIIKTSR